MDLKNTFLGDSITEGVGDSDSNQRYFELIAKRSGAECIGYGISGTRIATQFDSDPNSFNNFNHFSTRFSKMDSFYGALQSL